MKFKHIVYGLAVALIFIGCAKTEPVKTVSETAIQSMQTTTETTVEPETKDPFALKAGQVYSKLNGMPIDGALENKRIFGVMMDNYIKARPQAALDKADIVYEVLVEGQITRYFALFQSQAPELIGPIRSARPYYLRLALEYDAIYCHVGGSEQAKTDIYSLGINDVDGLSSGAETFWRKSHKKIPNNMYASSSSLLDWAKRRKYNLVGEFKAWQFANESIILEKDFPVIDVVYKAPTERDKIGYCITFEYDETEACYLRSVNGAPHLDEVTKERLIADNIVIQKANTNVIDSYGRLSIDIVGSGTGYYFVEGKMTPLTWQKSSNSARTRYYLPDGKELTFKRGKIWVQIVPNKFELTEPADKVSKMITEE